MRMRASDVLGAAASILPVLTSAVGVVLNETLQFMLEPHATSLLVCQAVLAAVSRDASAAFGFPVAILHYLGSLRLARVGAIDDAPWLEVWFAVYVQLAVLSIGCGLGWFSTVTPPDTAVSEC